MLQNKNPTPQRWGFCVWQSTRAFRALAPSVSLLGLKQTAMGTARPHRTPPCAQTSDSPSTRPRFTL